MAASPEFTVLEIPARIADLAFRVSVPSDWNSHELPPEEVDFSEPTAFVPLALVSAPWAAVVLTVAARPGFEDGTLQDWSLFLLSSQGIRPTAFGPESVGNREGLAGVGRQEQDGTWFEVRFAFFEDGGRFVHIGLFAPESISSPLESVWKTALQSFVLANPKGQTVPAGPGLGIVPERLPEPEPAEPSIPEPVPTVPAPSALAEANAPSPLQFTPADFGYFAKSDDLATLDPEHPVNARLRDKGIGFVPNMLASDLQAKTAKLGAGAIQAVIQVALGWHVNDDGRRTLLLDPEGNIQISLHILTKEGRSVDQILDDVQAEAEQSHPNPEFVRFEAGGMSALGVRNIVVNDEPIDQVHLLAPWSHDSAVLRARVTADPASTGFALDYAALILRSVEYGGPQQKEKPASLEPDEDGPVWWQLARKAEREDRLEEAEKLIRDGIQAIYCAIQIAEMYRLRWIRLRASDPAKAAAARQQAANWAHTYASWATSGGEGAALSLERDEFLRQLGPEPLE